jgi:uncharacterized protein (DUF1697 family)
MVGMDTTWVALLRGINVGGRNRVPMSDLRALVERLGHRQVSTYVQSGNVVFCSEAEEPALVAGIESALRETFGFDVAVVLRNRDELARIAQAHPFAGQEPEAAKLHVFFLGATPSAGAVGGFETDRFAPDTLVVVGREVYVHYPKGQGRSKLTIDRVERALGTLATGRNWRTVGKLVELAARSG